LIKVNIKNFSLPELTCWIENLGEKPYRADQIWTWIYQKNSSSFDGMSNLSQPLRTCLNNQASIYRLSLKTSHDSNVTKTRKFLWQLNDGLEIESVYIPEGKRKTFCISSQAGCAMNCGFCATATMGFKRNLEVFEITEQVLSMQVHIEEKATNLVVMGMGEPFNNYDHVIKALTTLNHPNGAAISHRKITLSTCGIVPMIERFTRERQPFKLAISLNATTNRIRSSLMPVNKKYPIESLLRAARAYTTTLKKRISFEYVLIEGINDSPEDASRLLQLLHDIPCKVNLIQYNPARRHLARPENRRIMQFADLIRPLCAPVTLRLSRGDDIRAACGQLVTGSGSVQNRVF
jgi:23S rRNA (adenine2503-C2)-methyltransferase